jgi:hypothetical protein
VPERSEVRRLALLITAAATFVALTACAGNEPPPVEACARAPAKPSATATVRPNKPFLGMLALPDTGVILARLDPLSLEPVSRQVELGEYHHAWSLSPDRSQLALGVSAPGRTGRVGIVVIDVNSLKVVREIETGGAAEALAWLTPDRLAASLVLEGTVLVNPLSGRILHRWPRLSEPLASARTPDGLVLLFPGQPMSTAEHEATAAPRLAVVNAEGRLRSITLDRIPLHVRSRHGIGFADGAGLTLDPSRARAYIVAADAPAADVDLRSLHVSYHRLEPLFLAPGALRGAKIQPNDVGARIRRAVWLGTGHALVFGRDLVPASGEDVTTIAAPATLVDTTSWSSCTLDASAGGAAFVGGRVLVYGGGDSASRGLRAYTVDAHADFHLVDRKLVWDVQASGNLAYVRGRVLMVSPQGGTRSRVYVVDVGSGKVLSEIRPPGDLVDVVAGHS